MALAATLTLMTTTAYALGGCGPDRHRNYYGYCVFGGQNQGSCLRRTGHVAARTPYGTYVCY